MSDSVRPHRRQPTRLRHPWDSPGKNTGVGCHFLLQCMKGKSESEVTQSCPTPSDPMDCSLPGSSIHGIFQARVLEWGPLPSRQLIFQCMSHEKKKYSLSILNSNLTRHLIFCLIHFPCATLKLHSFRKDPRAVSWFFPFDHSLFFLMAHTSHPTKGS